MTKQFTVNYGDSTRVIEGPDDATQEQAQQIADTQRDMSGETGRQGISNPFTGKPTGILGGDFGAAIGRKTANFMQGGAELGAAVPQLLGQTPGPLYQTAENAPHDFGDSLMRFAGATLPLAPLGAAKTTAPFKTTGRGAKGRFIQRTIQPAWGAAKVPSAVGAVEGAAAPADSRQERVVNTGLGALGGNLVKGVAQGASALDRLAGGLTGAGLAHMIGGHWAMPYIGASLGAGAGPTIHREMTEFLSKWPPSLVAQSLVRLGHPIAKAIADEYNSFYGSSNDQSQSK